MGVLIFANGVQDALRCEVALRAGITSLNLSGLPEVIARLEAGEIVVVGRNFTTGWRAPRGTVILMTAKFATNAKPEDVLQASARELAV